MAKEKKAESGRSKKGETAPATAKSNGKRKVKKDAKEDVQKELVIIDSSSSDFQNPNTSGVKSDSIEEEQVEVSGKEHVVDDSVETEAAANDTEPKRKKKKKTKEETEEDKNQKKEKKEKVKKEIDEKESSSLCQIPMARMSRIIKVEDPNVRISQDAVFIINKASEKFLQLFTTEAYASAFLDRKKYIDYKHLSSVVSKRRRFDFLSDFVPEKVKAEDALKESSAM